MGRIIKGQRFGKWTTLNTVRIKSSLSERVYTKWAVKCDCGTLQNVNGNDLNKGKSTKCLDCYGSTKKELSGKRFGNWEVLKESQERKGNKAYWICKCDCGSLKSVQGGSLLNGSSTKCIECYQKEMPDHGLSNHPLYPTWSTMKSRCENSRDKGYNNYGARGIKVCKKWHDLKTFIKDIGNKPKNTSLDRIDNNGDYTPENCRWSTGKEQSRNRRNNRTILFNGEEKCLSEWAEVLNVKVDTLFKYLERNTIEEAHEHYSEEVGIKISITES